jgi:hypothetical protein
MFLDEQYSIEIAPAKLHEYLLNRSHPLGWSKASYFFEHGIESVKTLQNILLNIVSKNPIAEIIKTEFGTKYIVEGRIDEHNVSLRTVWVVLNEENVCRFVTAYPL